ncbi:hypothetical protein AVEN_52061-1 [Araneus ventricosus]|uniref:CCHC-type domain-containing protein n=1 Tax=Araneus ventricosus TaxID=182803 RepID=A0A4Y2CF16_ARAVE|nr:hypothetical protein AVEN_52061-1 [Araneus ventricosus]
MGRKKGENNVEEGGSSSSVSNTELPNELQILIQSLDPDDFYEEVQETLRVLLTEFDKASTTAIYSRLEWGEKIRNKFTLDHFSGFVDLVKNLCGRLKNKDADIYDLQNVMSDCELSLARAKIWALEKEKAVLQAKLDIHNEISPSLEKIIPKLDELREVNNQKIMEEIPKIIKNVACPDMKQSLESASKQIIDEVKKNGVETRSFAQVALQSKHLTPRSSLPPSEPEGILLIKSKDDSHRDYEIKQKLFLDTLQSHSPEVRLRSVNKIYGGGIKLVAANTDEILNIRVVFKEHCTEETLDKFDLVIPNRRTPQIILYNITRDVDQEKLKNGLLAKNIFLADSTNKPHFKVEFKIAARNPRFNHWVLSINPKKFNDIMNKEGLYFQFSRLRFAEFILIRQCRKCFGFGHTTSKCDPQEKQHCDKCSEIKEEGHRCRGPRCSNCKD